MSSRRGGRGTRKHDRDKEEQGGQAEIVSQRMRLCEVGGYESERRVKAYDLGRERDAGDRSASVVGGEEEALSKRCVDKGKQMNETKLQSHYITPAIEYGRDERTNERTDTLTLSRLCILHFFLFFLCRGTFVEFRNGMINVSPIGRNASFVPASLLLFCRFPPYHSSYPSSPLHQTKQKANRSDCTFVLDPLPFALPPLNLLPYHALPVALNSETFDRSIATKSEPSSSNTTRSTGSEPSLSTPSRRGSPITA
jgi:hypothetical protein